MSGKQRYSAQQVADALRKAQGFISLAASELRCEPETVRNYMKRYPSVAAVVQQSRERMLDVAEGNLLALIRERNLGAIIFFLKTQGKQRGYVERTENINLNVDAQQLRRLLDAIETAGLSASEVFNDLIGELAREKQTPGAEDIAADARADSDGLRRASGHP